MLAMTTATVTAATLTSTTTVTPTTVTAAALKAAGMVETAAMVEIAAMKAAIVVEPAAKPKPDPDANGNCVAISAIIGVIRFGISVGGRLIIGSIGRSGGCAGNAVGTIESGHLAVLGRLGSGLVKPHQVIIEIAAARGLGRCGGETCRAGGDDQGSGEEGCKSAHDSLRVGADLSRRKRNASDAYSGFVKISAQTSPRRRRRNLGAHSALYIDVKERGRDIVTAAHQR